MKIAVVGGGPGGLYFAISMKLRDPSHQIDVYERNQAGDTFGWGVVFSDETMDNLRANDPVSAEPTGNQLAHWDDIDVHFKGAVESSTGHGFSGIGRKKLLGILQERARALDVGLHFGADVEPDPAQFGADLVVASDGVNSRFREAFAQHFRPETDVRANKFTWLGTHKTFPAFTFIFEQTEHGWVWAHAYNFDDKTSTFIVECSQETWDAFGFGEMTQDESCRTCERIFEAYLDGHELMSNAGHKQGSAWLNFPRVLCETWSHDNLVLLGDAAHTAHFSIGSGTKLAIEDAIMLAEVLNRPGLPVAEGLQQYEEERRLDVLRLQSAARNSTEWFETLDRHLQFEPIQFAYSLLTRSQRVSHENLRVRDRDWLERVESWFAGQPNTKPLPPMLTPFRIGNLALQNRIVVSPMCMYSAKEGVPNDFHLVHYGSRAQGGAGLIFTEMTDISAEARISPGCAGLYTDEQEAQWKRIVDFVHGQTEAKFAIQLAHAGPKGSTKLAWEGMDEPLEDGNWEIFGPSPVPWSPDNQIPREMTRAQMEKVRDGFTAATERAARCGFDMAELHCGHGYLLSAFLTPVTNKRTDEYGGSLENRLRFPLEVFAAMRAVWPKDKPMSMRISANDWVGADGVTGDEAVEIARAFHAAGADIINVSAGQTTREAKPVYGRMFQTPLSDQIRNEANVPTIAVGNIYEIDHVNSILAAGRADLVALARPHLIDPYWTLRMAAEQDVAPDRIAVPKQYAAGYDQLRRNARRAADMVSDV